MPRPTIERASTCTVTLDGEELLAFQGCDYLGLARHPALLAAAELHLGRGLSVGASRETTGTRPLHEGFEEALAEFLGFEAVLCLSSGTLANLAAVTALAPNGGAAVIDADAHPSLELAAKAADLDLWDYGPGDLGRAHALLDRQRGLEPLLLTDGVYTLGRRLAPLPDLLRLLPPHAHLVIDDSHGLGVLGPRGAGSTDYFGIAERGAGDERVVLTASLSKGLGVPAGLIAGSASTIARVRAHGEAYIASTPPPPCVAAAGMAALEVLSTENRRRARLLSNSRALASIGAALGVAPIDPPLPVLPLPVSNPADGERIETDLRRRGIFAPYVHYPGAPAAGFLRLAVNAEHGRADLERLGRALAESVGGGLGNGFPSPVD